MIRKVIKVCIIFHIKTYLPNSWTQCSLLFCFEHFVVELILWLNLASDHTNTEIPQLGGWRHLQCVFPDKYCTLSPLTAICSKFKARMWKEKRINKNLSKGAPIFSIRCKKGEVKLPPTLPTPPHLQHLYNDPLKSLEFQRNIRIYNAMFSFYFSLW